jgi:hypothetical protein
MGGIGNCCCDPCVLPGCSTVTLPNGSRSIKFATTGGTHPLPEQTIAVTFADSIACCTETSHSLNTLIVGDTFTREYTVNDQASSRSWICFPDLSFYKTAETDSEVRREGASAVQVNVRYCDLQVSTCAAIKVIYGVATCGIQVTVTLKIKSGMQSLGVGWEAAKGESRFYNPAGSVISTIPYWYLCDGPSTPTTAWPASPTIPSVSPTVRTCADTFPDACSITRSVFIPAVTSLPATTVVTLTAADTTTESPVGCSTNSLIFNPCPVVTVPRWVTTNDACGNPSYSGWDTNYGFVCDPNFLTATCGTAYPDLISRTRTQSETLSHPLGTYIFNMPAQTWTLTL